jgi:hypothetical protein
VYTPLYILIHHLGRAQISHVVGGELLKQSSFDRPWLVAGRAT